jgi:type IV pilus assembly protein PilM
MPMGAVVDGEIVDPAAVSTAIRELWRLPGIKGRDVVTGVSNQKVVVRLDGPAVHGA